MSGYILCQVKRAKLPYYIENISTNIYSIEELCFYLYHNMYLLDSTIINEELCFWIRDELGLKKLALKLYKLLEEENLKTGDFILPIFKEINYLSLEEFRELNRQIQRLAQEPEVLRQKLKGDYLIEYGKYVNAIKVYQRVLFEYQNAEEEKRSLMGGQFIGAVYHNMGCAYARLFQMKEAVACFSVACEHLHTMAAMKSLLYGIYMEDGEDAFEEKAEELGLDEQQWQEILKEAEEASEDIYETADGQEYAKALEEKQKGNSEGYKAAIQKMLERLTGEYHRCIG